MKMAATFVSLLGKLVIAKTSHQSNRNYVGTQFLRNDILVVTQGKKYNFRKKL